MRLDAQCVVCGTWYELTANAVVNGKRTCSVTCREERKRQNDDWRANRVVIARRAARIRRERDPDRPRMHVRRRRARLLGAMVHDVDERTVWEFNPGGPGQCSYCATELVFEHRKAWHIDHVVPLARGGLHELQNLVIACRTCNLAKGARTLDEWSAPATRV